MVPACEWMSSVTPFETCLWISFMWGVVGDGRVSRTRRELSSWKRGGGEGGGRREKRGGGEGRREGGRRREEEGGGGREKRGGGGM